MRSERARAAGLFLALSLGLGFLGTEAWAQGYTATLRGKVVDEQGAALPAVTITARNVGTNDTRSVTSGVGGLYFLPSLPAATYDVMAVLPGFATGKRAALVLKVSQEATVDFTLKVGQMSEEITVSTEAPILETTRNTIGSIINKNQIDALPVIDRD